MQNRLILWPIEGHGQTASLSSHPTGVVREIIDATVALYGRKGFVKPWIGYLAEEDGTCVGSCGFAGPPVQGEVEIAYFTFPGNEGRGIATRMASELLATTASDALRQDISFIAHTLPVSGASTTILKKLGFTLLGSINHPEDGTVWKWRRQ